MKLLNILKEFLMTEKNDYEKMLSEETVDNIVIVSSIFLNISFLEILYFDPQNVNIWNPWE